MNNGSGDAIICQDKTKMDESSLINQFNKLFDVEYGIMSVEPHYSKIKPCMNFYTREMLLEMGQKTDLSLVR